MRIYIYIYIYAYTYKYIYIYIYICVCVCVCVCVYVCVCVPQTVYDRRISNFYFMLLYVGIQSFILTLIFQPSSFYLSDVIAVPLCHIQLVGTSIGVDILILFCFFCLTSLVLCMPQFPTSCLSIESSDFFLGYIERTF